MAVGDRTDSIVVCRLRPCCRFNVNVFQDCLTFDVDSSFGCSLLYRMDALRFISIVHGICFQTEELMQFE